MKNVLLSILLVLSAASGGVCQSTPYDPFPTYEQGLAKGKPQPVIPEPSTYGAIFVGSSLLMVWAIKHKRKKS